MTLTQRLAWPPLLQARSQRPAPCGCVGASRHDGAFPPPARTLDGRRWLSRRAAAAQPVGAAYSDHAAANR